MLLNILFAIMMLSGAYLVWRVWNFFVEVSDYSERNYSKYGVGIFKYYDFRKNVYNENFAHYHYRSLKCKCSYIRMTIRCTSWEDLEKKQISIWNFLDKTCSHGDDYVLTVGNHYLSGDDSESPFAKMLDAVSHNCFFIYIKKDNKSLNPQKLLNFIKLKFCMTNVPCAIDRMFQELVLKDSPELCLKPMDDI